MNRLNLALAAGIALLLASLYAIRLKGRSFDPEAVAAAETRMWQAYYRQDPAALGREIVLLLRGQFGLSLQQALDAGKPLASAAVRFETADGGYEKGCLADLELAYARLRAATGASFDPAEAARAELAWWVARRTPGGNDDDTVGAKIAHLYAVLYGKERPQFREAGILRARAARLRDAEGSGCDWSEVRRLLAASYSRLLDGL